MTRVFAYIINVKPTYKLEGSVPFVVEGKVFFGPCKKTMRPHVIEGDYIMGISSKNGMPRRVLLFMRVEEIMTFAEAWDRGKTDRKFRAARQNAIHVIPKPYLKSYEHIIGATHISDWETDISGTRDCLFTGDFGSWCAEKTGPKVDTDLVMFFQEALGRRGVATIKHPLTKNARGYLEVTGKDAEDIRLWANLNKPNERLVNSEPRSYTISCIKFDDHYYRGTINCERDAKKKGVREIAWTCPHKHPTSRTAKACAVEFEYKNRMKIFSKGESK